MFRSTVIVTILNLLSLAMSFVVNLLISYKFGVGFEMDSYWAALTVPSYIVVVLTSVLSFTFIPVFAKYNQENSSEGWYIVNTFICFVGILLIGVIVIGIYFASNIIHFIAPGFDLKQSTYSCQLLQFYFPIIFFSSLNELVASIFYSNGHFKQPLLNKLINPVITIVFVLLLSKFISVKSLVFANLFGAITQFCILWVVGRKKQIFVFKPNFHLSHPGVKVVFKLMLPLLLSSLIYKFFPIFDTMILSKFPEGSISSINYANRVQSLIGTVIASIFSVQVFSFMSNITAKKDWMELKTNLSFFLRILFFISIPIAVFIFIFGTSVVRLLFERGTFMSEDTIAVSGFLRIYILCLPAVAVGSILSQGIYAMQDTKSVMLVGIFEFVFYVVGCLLLVKSIGSFAIPLVFMINFNLTALIFMIILRKKLKLGGGRGVITTMLKSLGLALVIGIAFYYLNQLLNLADIYIVILLMVGIIMYYLMSLVLKFEESAIINLKINEILSKNKK